MHVLAPGRSETGFRWIMETARVHVPFAVFFVESPPPLSRMKPWLNVVVRKRETENVVLRDNPSGIALPRACSPPTSTNEHTRHTYT